VVLRGERRSPAGAHSIPIWSRWRSVTLTVSGTTGRITRATGTVYHHDDHLGSTRVCTDASGVSTGACDYEPFGEVQPGTTCSVPTAFRFAGMRFDSDTGLYHTPFRQYDPNQARWMGVDLVPGSTAVPQSLDGFVYVFNDPVNGIDTTGLLAEFIGGQAVSCYSDGLQMPCGDWMQVYGEKFRRWLWGREACLGPTGKLAVCGPEDLPRLFIVKNVWLADLLPKDRFADCLAKHGDKYAKANLTYPSFMAAQNAAKNAQIDTSAVLALWHNESKLSPAFGKAGPKGEQGPIQVRPGVAKELQGAKLIPKGTSWKTNLQANLNAGALYYARMSDHYNVPESQAAAAYNGGPYGAKYAQGYQKAFDSLKKMFSALVNCMR